MWRSGPLRRCLEDADPGQTLDQPAFVEGRVEALELAPVAYKSLARHAVVLGMPAERSLTRVETVAALVQHLAFAVRLGANRVVLEQKLPPEDPSVGKGNVVPGGRGQAHALAWVPPGSALVKMSGMA